jgi:methyl-accepting chemotaxis protein
MISSTQSQSRGSLADTPAGEALQEGLGMDTELARYLAHFRRMSAQLKETSTQIESSVVGVCDSFQGIAERATSTVSRTTGFLSSKGDGASSKVSFEGLIHNCAAVLVKILNSTEEAGEVSRRAIDRIHQMDEHSKMILESLAKLEKIAHENKMLALNARIEAAHAGVHGAGFSVVAVEVAAQTQRSLAVTAQVSGLIDNLRNLAGSAMEDLQRMNQQGSMRVEKSKREVDESLRDMQYAHSEMKQMLSSMTKDGALLASDIGAAVRGLQFQDRTSQQIAHVVEDLDTLHARLISRCGAVPASNAASEEGFSAHTMHEERQIAGIHTVESAAGDIELF